MRPDRVNEREPRPHPLEVVPEPPAHLDAVGREVWEDLLPSLHAAGVVSAWDLVTFAVFCELVSIERQSAELVRAGLLTRGRRDRLVMNPAWRILRDCVAQLRTYAREFGLTPSARSGLVVEVDRPRPGPST